MNYIRKGMKVATVLECNGIWISSGKFGCTFNCIQVVTSAPRDKLPKKCLINLTPSQKQAIAEKEEEEEEEDSDEDDGDEDSDEDGSADSGDENKEATNNDLPPTPETQKNFDDALGQMNDAEGQDR
jgi:hypothetical protein